MKITLDVILIQFATCILNGARQDVMTEEMREEGTTLGRYQTCRIQTQRATNKTTTTVTSLTLSKF